MFAIVICLVLLMCTLTIQSSVLCVLMVDGMSVLVNVMLSLMSVMSLVQPIGAYCCEVMYLGCFGFRGELGFLNCDDICMYLVNKQFELLEFVLSPFMLTCSMMRFLLLLLLGLCDCVVFVVLW